MVFGSTYWFPSACEPLASQGPVTRCEPAHMRSDFLSAVVQIHKLATYNDAAAPAVTRILFTEADIQARGCGCRDRTPSACACGELVQRPHRGQPPADRGSDCFTALSAPTELRSGAPLHRRKPTCPPPAVPVERGQRRTDVAGARGQREAWHVPPWQLPASACVSLHQPASACISLRQPASACVSRHQPA